MRQPDIKPSLAPTGPVIGQHNGIVIDAKNAKRTSKGKPPLSAAETALLYLMLSKGVRTYRELSKLTGLDRATFTDTIRGKQRANAGTVSAIAMGLGVELRYVQAAYAQVVPADLGTEDPSESGDDR